VCEVGRRSYASGEGGSAAFQPPGIECVQVIRRVHGDGRLPECAGPKTPPDRTGSKSQDMREASAAPSRQEHPEKAEDHDVAGSGAAWSFEMPHRGDARLTK
jgi:hypothetical protein